RSTARCALVALLLLLGPASLAAAPPKGSGVPRLIFPVVGPALYTDDFGQPRAGGPHQGNDLLATRRQLAVAVEPGTVSFWTTSAGAGCMLYLHGDSGTTYEYIHLNNDLTADDVALGVQVQTLRVSTGLRVTRIDRLVTLAIDPGLATDALQLGGPVRVTTSRVPLSLDQELGVDGALTAKIVAGVSS